ncbi:MULTISPECIES: efflux RND transporter permease subunit [unclassified Bradyrhizobium]|uniref:efflux RND transporter permease subunit n=1 Tax=unclassified Bradyrhizobium TaxID=2631580 RepID=UPI0003F74466|nr:MULTISPECIES: CusA/CzcA family heavy metal efflux RND transporter [unclassified Bradyrhizobium]QIG92641.1 CusA/CzcA family heavy metal efflux RND transporter [Bradyrhizobium sp. 6(2017)]
MIERIIGLAIQRRWVVVTLAAIAMFLGGLALTRLPIDAVPDITNKQIQINTLAPALSPAEIEKQVTFPIETALAGAPGLESTRSLSRNGFSQITAVFSEATNIYFARQQVGERLTEVRARLPQGVEPRMGPTSTGLGEVYMWSVHFSGQPAPANGAPGLQSDGRFLTADGQMLQSDVEKDAYLRTVQDWIIKPRIKMVPGVAGVDSIGGYLKQYHVYPDAAKLIALGLTFADVARAIESNNVSRGARYIERNGEGLVVRSGGRLQNIDELGAVVVTTRGGVPIRIRDIATVSIGGETRTGSASEDGREVVVGVALMLIGANSRTVSAAVDARLRSITPSLPPGVEVTTVLDRTELVDATIGTVARNLSEGALLVIAVLFMLLGNFRAALITALVIPIAMLMTAIGMWQGRISANLMSLGALDFGLIVDGAVIITENSLRHLAEKQRALGRVLTRDERLATVHASAVEMVQPSLYGQAIILLVYVPLLTFTGVEGKMFEPMALTVILALAAAFVLSLTLVPALIAISISGRVQEEENRLVATLKRWYHPLLRRAVATPIPVIAVAVVLFGAALFGFSRLGQEFIPSLDEKNIAMHALRIPSTSLSQSQAMQLSVEKTVSRFPQVSFVFSKTGTPEVASDPMPPNASDTFIMLKPREQWPDPSMTKEQLIGDISKAVGRLPGNVYEFTQPIQMRFNELLAGVRGDIAVKVFGDEFEPMQKAANQVAAALRSVRGATDVKVEQTSGLPILEIKVDKAAIARRGLSVSAVHDVIGTAVGGQDAGVVYEGDRSFDIVVRLPESVRSDLEALSNLPVALPKATPNSPVQSLPLNRVAQFSFTEGPNQISRENGKRRIVVTANVRGRDLGSVVEEAQANVAQSVKLPPGYWMTWGGQSENLAAARQRLAVVVPACFAMIFLLLLAAMGSARDALLVFSAVPLALTGGIAALWLRGMPFSISAAVGFIALSGVAVLNGLVMLSFVRQLRERGVPLREAIEQGALTRFRPVVMTALVASLGFVPMAFATGTGAEVQKPLATVVIGGLISATLLTLAVLPALYARYGHAGSAARNERAATQPAE